MKARPDIETLRRLYVDEQVPPSRIGRMLGYDTRTVSEWLRKARIPTRRRRKNPQGVVKGTLVRLIGEGPITAEDLSIATRISLRCARAHLSNHTRTGMLKVVGRVPYGNGRITGLYGAAA